MELKAQSLIDLREQIQDDLLCWAGDKELDEHDKSVMCLIVQDRINALLPEQKFYE